MRLSTYDKPRVIACAEDHPQHIGLPRGCLDEVRDALSDLGVGTTIRDERHVGRPIDVTFQGELRAEQQAAAEAMLAHDTGVLAATTAFGKTVIAAWLIAQRGVNTLVLVHRRQLLDQWIERLSTFLGRAGEVDRSHRRRALQADRSSSTWRSFRVSSRRASWTICVADYGQLIVDECHHLSAHSFEQVARQAKARFVVGLSATVARKDGHHPIIFMQCGPVRHRVNASAQAAARPFEHFVLVQPTTFQPARAPDPDKRVEFQALYQELIKDRDAQRAHLSTMSWSASTAAGRRSCSRSATTTSMISSACYLGASVTWSSCGPDWARSSDSWAPIGWRRFRAVSNASFSRLASTWARVSTTPVWTRCS